MIHGCLLYVLLKQAVTDSSISGHILLSIDHLFHELHLSLMGIGLRQDQARQSHYLVSAFQTTRCHSVISLNQKQLQPG